MSHSLRRYASPLDLVLGASLFLAVVLLPAVTGFRGTIPSIVLFVAIYLVLTLGLNIVVGFAGLLDIGYVVFMAFGAVTAAFLMSLTRTPDGSIDWRIGKTSPVLGDPVFDFAGSIFVILLAAGGACAILGILRGIPTLRVTGDYYAIVTIGFAEIFYEMFLWDETTPFEGNRLNFSRFTGGAFPITLDRANRPSLFGEVLDYSAWPFYYLVIACAFLTMIATHHLNRSRTGRALAAIRLDETAARSCGVNVTKTKLVAFAVSGFLGGIGGALYSLWVGAVAVTSLNVWISIIVLSCIVLGGMGSVRGVILGTIVLAPLGEILRKQIGGVTIPAEARFLVYGIILVALMRFRPQGLLPPNRRGEPLAEEDRMKRLLKPAPLFTLSPPARGPRREKEGGAS